MKVVSFFSGCGGLDLGFEQAGFEVVWANDNDPVVKETYLLNHPGTYLCHKDMRELTMGEIPECDGFIGGPPCQSWSEGGKQLGLDDERGKMFLTYIQFIQARQPKFFVIENVKGILGDKHFPTFMKMLGQLKNAGYVVHYQLMNAMDYHVPQERYRVFVVGIRRDIDVNYQFPEPDTSCFITLRQAIGEITEKPRKYISEPVNAEYGQWLNHDVYMGPFDDRQLRMSLENKLYYVRAGLRAGAMQFSLGMKAPHYLFLHKKGSYILLILKEVEPRLVSAEYLENLGFHPSGDQYWVFEVLDVETENRTECIKSYVSEHGGMKMKPYILELKL